MKKQTSHILLIACAAAILSLGNTAPVVYFKGSTQRIFFPENKIIFQANSKLISFSLTLSQISQLVKENTILREENEKLSARSAQMVELENRLAILEKELSLKSTANSQKFVAAAVVGRTPSNYRSSLTIDRGKEDGIVKNAPVVSAGFLIGKVAEVYSRSSLVELVTSHRFLAPVILQDSRTLGMLRGGIKGAQVEQLPADGQIKAGEMVVTSGLAGELPAGIPVGKIQSMVSKPSDIFQTAAVESPVNINRVEIALVILQ